jgi:hypothetical protein
MPRRRSALLLSVLLVATAGCTAFGTPSAEVTVENSESTSYQMTAYVFDEPVGAGNVTFRVANDTGVRTVVESRRLDGDGPYYNHSLGGEWTATERQVSVPAHGTTTASFDTWAPGGAVAYVFEAPDGRVVRYAFAECPSGSVEHTFVFSDGPENGYRERCSTAA